ncbi:alpha/beta hydrolase [Mucilaginibacter psychrotolerans]|uniref:Alpha/beta hydrolase n=1 Tax=Mucilaginibacter psychrotolerans TaxID=1524096 RepID=A0A4Y8SFC8_9SPHI|nr:alpha/beta hydrolase [Mucilaginibacter psychrotolerans]TFF37783.1 alpha/beta hydrolase [Mucilaginibacter psychrotolerans]
MFDRKGKSKVKAFLLYLIKIIAAGLFWLITYLMLIVISNGAQHGTIAALGAGLTAGVNLAIFIEKKIIQRGTQRYIMIFLFSIFIIFIVHTAIPVASDDNPKRAPDFKEVPTRYWHLKTGSDIAYYKIAAKKGSLKKSTPIIFLHGGPGAYVRKLDLDFFKSFASDGYDVYLYDQAGAGRSGLLSKSEYSHNRNMRDFAAITDVIHADQYIVIGQSYGGSLLADLASDKNTFGRIYKAIYVEPGVTVPSSSPIVFAKSPNALAGDVSLPIRIIIGMMINPKGGFTSQNEVINYLAGHPDLVQKLFLQSFPRKDAERVPKVEPNVINFSVVGIIQPQITLLNKDLKTPFERYRVRSMLMLGGSSYIERNAPLDLLRVNPNIERVQYFRNTGHILWNGLDDNDKQVKASIDAFLNDMAPALPDFPRVKDIQKFIKEGM